MERRPIGLAVAILALLLAGGASFLFDSSPAPRSSQAAMLSGESGPGSAAPASGGTPPPDDGPASAPDVAADSLQDTGATSAAQPAVSPDSSPKAPALAAGSDAGDGLPQPIGSAPIPTGPETQPLANLAPAAVARIAALPNQISIAAIDLRRGLTFTHNANAYYDLASLAKVPLMLTFLELMESERRGPSEAEQTLLELMIQWSDNQAADALWERVGGDRERALVEALQLWPRILFVEDGWGGLEGSAYGVALLFGEIVSGAVLSPALRAQATDLIDGVAHFQRWGLSAGLPEDQGGTVFLKNGWYPTDAGWLVHSAGVVRDAAGRPDYVVAILSADHASLQDGIDIVEAIATDLHAALRPADARGAAGRTLR